MFIHRKTTIDTKHTIQYEYEWDDSCVRIVVVIDVVPILITEVIVVDASIVSSEKQRESYDDKLILRDLYINPIKIKGYM